MYKGIIKRTVKAVNVTDEALLVSNVKLGVQAAQWQYQLQLIEKRPARYYSFTLLQFGLFQSASMK